MDELNTKRVIFLSGAPRVSTNPIASAGGPRAHILGVIGAFEELGFKVDRYIVGDLSPRQWIENDYSTTISRSWWKRVIADVIRLMFRFYHRRRAFRLLSGPTPYIYERYAAFQELGAIFKKKKNAFWILESNGITFHEAKHERKATSSSWLLKHFEKRAYQKSDLIVAVSETLKSRIVTTFGIAGSNVLVIPNGGDTQFFDPALYAAKRYSAEFTVGFVGALIEYQRLDILFQSVKILSEKDIPIHVVVVGDGIEFENWKKLTSDLQIFDQVTFAGKVSRDEIPALIMGFDIGYSVPDPELAGQYVSPLKIYEYLAMNVPVLAFHSDDAGKTIKYNTGILIEKLNVLEVANGIEFAYLNQEQFRGNQCREEIVNNHSWKSRIEIVLDYLKENGKN